MTSEVKHFMVWHYAHDQYRDTEPWLWRHTIYRILGVKVWTRRERKVYLPIWSWATSVFGDVPRQYFSCFGGEPVSYNWETGEVSQPDREASSVRT